MGARKAAVKETAAAAVNKAAKTPQQAARAVAAAAPAPKRPSFSGVVGPAFVSMLLEQIGRAVDGEQAGITVIVSRDGPHSPDVRALGTCRISMRGLMPSVDGFAWTVDSQEIGVHLGTYAEHYPDPLAVAGGNALPPGQPRESREEIGVYHPGLSRDAALSAQVEAGAPKPQPKPGEPLTEDPARVAKVAAAREAAAKSVEA